MALPPCAILAAAMPLTLARSSESRQEFGNRALGWIFDRRRDSQSICRRNGEILFAARFCGLAISESGPIALQRVAEFLCDLGCAIPFGSSTQRMRVDCCTIERSSRCKKLDGSTSEKQPDATPADQIVGHFETSHVVRFAWSPKNISCGEIGSSRFLNQLRVVHVVQSGGDGGIRTLDRALQPYNGLANRRLQPLGHVSRTADMPDAAASRKRQIACCHAHQAVVNTVVTDRWTWSADSGRPLRRVRCARSSRRRHIFGGKGGAG